jgi:hypothetical protein
VEAALNLLLTAQAASAVLAVVGQAVQELAQTTEAAQVVLSPLEVLAALE